MLGGTGRNLRPVSSRPLSGKGLWGNREQLAKFVRVESRSHPGLSTS